MTKPLVFNHKRGISEIVSYVLLVVIAVGLSVAVYAFINAYIPKEKPVCPTDVFLGTSTIACTTSTEGGAQLSLGLVNKGLFTVNAAYIRVGKQGREVTFLINDPNKNGGSVQGFYLSEPGESTTQGLAPGKETSYLYAVPSSIISSPGTYTLEIQPAVGRGNNLVLCETGVSRQEFTCT